MSISVMEQSAHLGAMHRSHVILVSIAAIILLALVPLMRIEVPPMVDMLGHIGRYSIQTGIEDHPWLKQYFAFHWHVIGNLGADILIQLLAPVFGVEASVRIIVLLAQALAASSILLLCRQVHGRITPFCLFALPLIYSFPFNFGFINFILGMALALFAFTLWLRLAPDNCSTIRNWLFVPIGLAIWLCHTFGWAFLGLLCAAEGLVRSREAGRPWLMALWDAGWRCLPLAAPLLPMLAWRSQASPGAHTEGWFLILTKLVWVMSVLRLDNLAVDALSATLLLSLIYVGMRASVFARNPTMVAAAGLCLIAFILLPVRLLGSYFADMRLAPYMFLIALLAVDDRPLDAKWRRRLTIAGACFLIFRIALTTGVYAERERELNAHLTALQAIPERSRIATLVAQPCGNAWGLPWLTHLGSMAIARRQAFSNDQWAGGGVNLLTIDYPAAGDFSQDTSEMVFVENCKSLARDMNRTMDLIPAAAFTHVWVIGVSPSALATRKGFTPVWQGPDSIVYRIANGTPNQIAER